MGWQVDQDMAIDAMMIHQSVLIRDFVIEERLINCNANVIFIKADSSIEVTAP